MATMADGNAIYLDSSYFWLMLLPYVLVVDVNPQLRHKLAGVIAKWQMLWPLQNGVWWQMLLPVADGIATGSLFTST